MSDTSGFFLFLFYKYLDIVFLVLRFVLHLHYQRTVTSWGSSWGSGWGTKHGLLKRWGDLGT